jgi:hypothetical protein
MKPDKALQVRQGKRLQEAREEAGYKFRRTAAIDNGWIYSTYSAHERGTRTIGRDDAEKYIRVFQSLGTKITAKSVLFPDDKSEAAEPATDPDQDAAYQRGWNDAVRAIAEAASAGQMHRKPQAKHRESTTTIDPKRKRRLIG